ncbi:S41 family peptidase [Aquimarina sediminis]|uniref:S41 family peptidase n=1 Tax=Aquimarina sediminis TaxID=2070536 RepID=UPI000CA04317|nr:S41 family peptidase [Aquimarina sediminis]
MFKSSKLLFVTLFLWSNNILFAQQKISGIDFGKTLSIKELKEDFRIMRRHIETIHPGLYTYTNKTEMDTIFDELEKSINTPMSSIMFYRKIVLLLQFIKNGHTNILTNLEYEKAIKESFTLFPFEIYPDDGQLYILKNNSTNSLIKEGSIIKSINGKDAMTLFTQISNKISRDGNMTTFAQMVALHRFNEFYAAHEGVYQSYDIEYITPNGKTTKSTVKGLTVKEIKKNKWDRYQDDGKWWGETNEPVLKLKIDNDVAILKIQTFSTYFAKKVKQNFKKFFNKSFEQIEEKGVKHLIIDLRGNGGGHEKPTHLLFSHLSDKPFVFNKDMYAITNKIPDPELYDNSRFVMNFLYPLFCLKKRGGVYTIKGIPGMQKHKPAKTVFKGKVYVLINGLSFSASGEITSFIRNANRAVFIGEEVGGNACQNVSGATVMLTLPNSKNRIRIPRELFTLNVDSEQCDRGVIPDHYIRPSITDKLMGTDPEMDFTLNLIKNQ